MKVYFFLIIILLLYDCNNHSKKIVRLESSYIQKGYVRAYSSVFTYHSYLIDSLEDLYYIDFLQKHNKEKQAFFTFPSVKKNINIFVGFPGEIFRKADGCIDTIEIYVDNKLCNTGLYPYTLGCRTNYPNLPTHPQFIYNNERKAQTAHINIVFRKDRIYFDTIIPLRFNEVNILNKLNGEFSISFGKALD